MRITLHAEHLDVTREIITEKCGEFLGNFDAVMKQRGGYMFNMFIMSKELVNDYCSWLFPILFELENVFLRNNIQHSTLVFMDV